MNADYERLPDTRTPLQRLTGIPLRLTLILIAVLAVSFGLYWLTDSGPNERLRITHPAGYSIIQPKGWVAKIVIAANGPVKDAIELAPEKWKGLSPSMWVRQLAIAPDLQDLRDRGYVSLPFGNRQAWIFQEKPKQYVFRRAVVQTDNRWFEVGVSLPGLEALKMDDWWRYAQSLRDDGPGKPVNTTAPAG